MILALETSGRSGSAAIYFPSGDVVTAFTPLAEGSARTLAPAISQLLEASRIRPSELTAVAVTVGPGSFTGLRVGVALAKAIAYGLKIPVIGVDTLEVIATDFQHWLEYFEFCPCKSPILASGELASGDDTLKSLEFWTALDAYRGEFFVAKWLISKIQPESLVAKYDLPLSGALSIDCVMPSHIVARLAWYESCASEASQVTVVGSGCAKLRSGPLIFDRSVVWHPNILPTAMSVGRIGYQKLSSGKAVSPMELMPVYLRGSAAEEKKGAEASKLPGSCQAN